MPLSFLLPVHFLAFRLPIRFGALLLGFAVSVSSAWVPSPASGQTSDQPVAGYVMKRWTTAEGLPHDSISALRETRDGFLWVGTANAGVVRFDGVTFQTFNLANTPALLSNRIAVLHEDHDGTLWIGTGAGLVRYRDGAFSSERFGDTPSHNVIVDLRDDRDGRLWVAAEGRVSRRDGERWTAISTDGAVVEGLSPSHDGTMWIATRAGLVEWREGVVRTLTTRDGLPSDAVFAVHEDRSGHVWIGTARGLVSLDRSNGGVTVERRIAPAVPIYALFEDSSGMLWIGGRGGLFTRGIDGTLTDAALASGSDTDPGLVTAFTEDREGYLWFGVEQYRGGLHRLGRERVTTLAGREGLPCDNVGPVTQAADGTIWLATLCNDGRGVVALRDGRITLYAGPKAVESLLAEPDGNVWVGTFDGALFHLKGDRFVEIPAPTREEGDDIATLYRHADGALWLGTTRGLVRWHRGQWTRFQTRDGLVSDDVRSIVSDRNGAMWVGMDGGVSRLYEERFTSYRVADGVPSGPVRALHVDAEGVLWIGTYGGGLARFKDGAFTSYGERGGVLDSSVHRILEDDDGYLWLTGDRGIRRVSKRDLNAIADSQTESLDVTRYDEADGMRNAECNGMAQPAGWRMRDGTFQFPTQRGVVRIDPSRAGRSTPPAPMPQVQRVIVDGTSASIDQEVVIPPGHRDVEIRYTAPALVRPDQVQFRYRVEGAGAGADWTEVGTRRSASFVNLRPGRYRVIVAARNGGGPWSEQPAAVQLVLQPFFYQRTWFQLALIALAAGVTAIAGRWYVGNLRRRAEQLERAVGERTADLSIAHERVSVANEGLLKAKDEVEQAHGQVLGVLNQLDMGVLVLTGDGLVHYASASAQHVLRKDEHALVGRSWSACLPLVDADRARFKARVESLSRSEGRVPVQMVIGGARYWMELDIRNEPPPGERRIVYMYDVTELSALPSSDDSLGAHGLVGRSTAMHLVYKQIGDVARVDATVLIEGETGVGKELVARAIHRESRRRDKPFVAVNAAGLSESLLASQLFGHRRGAFTGAVDDQVGLFEAANGGTLFLDEIGDMPLNMQASLLRVLQEREITRVGESQARRIDVRFLAATHRDLAREVDEGRFREDLLYRIRVARVVVPPLRERMDDVPVLADAFLTHAARAAERPTPLVSRETMNALLRYSWPGNVRELKAAIERALTNAQGDVIGPEALPTEVVTVRVPVEAAHAAAIDAESERDRLIQALRRAGGNRSEAARLLGIHRRSFYRKLAEHGLD